MLRHSGANSISYNLKAIEEKLVAASLTWKDKLHQALFTQYGECDCQELFDRYGEGFNKGYQERFTAEEAIKDIQEMERALSEGSLRSHLKYAPGQDKSKLQFKIYSLKDPVSLSDVLPVLKNMNCKVQNEIPFLIKLSDGKKVWIHDFEIETQDGDPVVIEDIYDHFIEGFSRIWHKEVENDGFNRLILSANLSWKDCQLIRAYAKYIRQLHVTFSQPYMQEVLTKYPRLVHLILKLFEIQFNPLCKEDRESVRDEILQRIQVQLEGVDSLDEDRILRKFINAISASLRTNFYQLQGNKSKSYLSFKIDCHAIDEMPLPRPRYEIFVYSPRFEAVHLRGGKVARGGIRWSDRREDFRTEILGLMKAQMIKNAVIVPTGSKGGFVVKRPPSKGDREALMKEVIYCYKTMMKGLLDLTDNLQGRTVIPPKDVVRRDEDDTYLVVAADKGTSTFSDYANQISADYNYWLGDAFASGGSTGYDHKKMAITARGAWESVRRHFREMEINADQENLTVVGIGDMSGDVFGNGVLLSKHLKLLAAFDHLHIFIDPSPNPKKSFDERKRLFNLPRSSWDDYSAELISKGGGVFSRKAKSINITPEMKELFCIREKQLPPSKLIQYILKAKVDLIWFGGIGTYIKATSETNSEVEDIINDALRVNGNEVQAKVIAEGANLGVTQLGRVEYAIKGGRINTDAIDNSAGVDCSDHEVNIKTLLGQAIAKKKLTLKNRNVLLEEMTDEVASLVLRDNFWQNQVISLVRSQGLRLMDEQARLMRDLEEEGLLNRALEGLPDETEISRRIVDKKGLTRPELAVLLAYAKISLKNQLLHCELPDLEILQARLFSYFPKELRESYKEEIKTHPLRREIIITLITNSVVNRMGITFVHEMKRQLDVEGSDVMRAYLIVRDLLDLVALWQDLEGTENLPAHFDTELMLTIYENVKRFTDWFLRFNKEYHDIEKTLKYFKEDFDTLLKHLPSLFTPHQRKSYEKKMQEYESLGVPNSLAKRFLSLAPLVSAPDIILLSKQTKVPLKDVARLYFALGHQLGFGWLRKIAFSLSGENHWQQGAASALIEDLYISQKNLTQQILMTGKPLNKILTDTGSLAPDIIYAPNVEATLVDLKNASNVNFSMMTVMNRQLRLLAQGTSIVRSGLN